MLTERDKIYLKLVESLGKLPGAKRGVIVITRDDRAIASTIKGINDLMMFLMRERINTMGCKVYTNNFRNEVDRDMYGAWGINYIVFTSPAIKAPMKIRL